MPVQRDLCNDKVDIDEIDPVVVDCAFKTISMFNRIIYLLLHLRPSQLSFINILLRIYLLFNYREVLYI